MHGVDRVHFHHHGHPGSSILVCLQGCPGVIEDGGSQGHGDGGWLTVDGRVANDGG